MSWVEHDLFESKNYLMVEVVVGVFSGPGWAKFTYQQIGFPWGCSAPPDPPHERAGLPPRPQRGVPRGPAGPRGGMRALPPRPGEQVFTLSPKRKYFDQPGALSSAHRSADFS